jgi:uncharacterized protein YggE
MRKPWVVLVLVMTATLQAFAGALPDSEHVYVSAVGETKAVPDIAVFSLSIEKVLNDLKEAKTDVDRRTDSVLQLAKKLGMKPDDAKSTELRMYPKYDWQDKTRVFQGYCVSRDITLTLRDVGKLTQLVDGLVEAEISEIEHTEMQSSVQDDLEARALADAIAKAKQKAQSIASQFGADLGPVFSVSEVPLDGSSSGGICYLREALPEMETFSPGTITISKSIFVAFKLKPKP